MTLQFFRVAIIDTGFSTTAPADGFIELLPVWQDPAYDANPSKPPVAGTDIPTDLSFGLAKARGLFRWNQIKQNISMACVPFFMGNVTDQTGINGTIDSPPTEIQFTVGYYQSSYLKTDDELVPGTELVGALALKRFIARTLSSSYNGILSVLNPEFDDSSTRITGIQMLNVTADAPESDLATAEANVTVTKIIGIN